MRKFIADKFFNIPGRGLVASVHIDPKDKIPPTKTLVSINGITYVIRGEGYGTTLGYPPKRLPGVGLLVSKYKGD